MIGTTLTRKTPENIATWVASAVGETIPTEGEESTVTVSARFEANAGDYQKVSVRADGLTMPEGERFAADVEGRTIHFMALENRGDGEYLLRVRVE